MQKWRAIETICEQIIVNRCQNQGCESIIVWIVPGCTTLGRCMREFLSSEWPRQRSWRSGEAATLLREHEGPIRFMVGGGNSPRRFAAHVDRLMVIGQKEDIGRKTDPRFGEDISKPMDRERKSRMSLSGETERPRGVGVNGVRNRRNLCTLRSLDPQTVILSNYRFLGPSKPQTLGNLRIYECSHFWGLIFGRVQNFQAIFRAGDVIFVVVPFKCSCSSQSCAAGTSSKVEITSYSDGKPRAMFGSLSKVQVFSRYRKHLFTRSRQLRKLETVLTVRPYLKLVIIIMF